MPTLQFKGKSFVSNHHLAVKYHQLLPNAAASLTDKVSLNDNLIIHGDNLIALKALLPNYAGRVKCIYIDPPYNTGNEGWRYNDNVNSPMIQEWLRSQQPVDREDLTRHDKWLCMMLPRLTLLRELLREDGVIFVSIDDNEVQHLRMLMDEIFGADNFIAQLAWEKGRKNDARLFSIGHEYILVYAYSLAKLKELKTVWREAKPGAQEIWNEYIRLRALHKDDDPAVEQALQEWYRQLPKSSPSKLLSRYRHIDKYGPWRDDNISWPGGNGPSYDVIHPVTGQPCKVPERGWIFPTLERMQQQIDWGLVVFREDHTQPPFRKAHLRPIAEELEEDALAQIAGDTFENADELVADDDSEAIVGLQVMPSVIYKQSQVAVRYLRDLMGAKVFDNPKDHEVIMRLLRYCTEPDKGDIVLDSFAGSGTTGQAVLQLNQGDGGNRHFILVETEDYADTLTAERLRRVIEGVPGFKDARVRAGLGGSFSFFELGAPLDIAGVLAGTELPRYEDLARYLFYTATGEEFDPALLDEAQSFVGESAQYRVYLLYQPAVEYLKQAALTLERIQALPDDGSKQRLVFAPTRFVDPSYLETYNVKYAQLPFEIYRFHY